MTTRYIALVDGRAGAYGVTFPDAPGCTAMGKTIDEAMKNAAVSLVEWIDLYGSTPSASSAEVLHSDPEVAEQIASGAAFVIVPLVREIGRSVRANLSIDAGLLQAIDEAATAAGMTRSAFLVAAARDRIGSTA